MYRWSVSDSSSVSVCRIIGGVREHVVDEECVWSADMSLVMWYSGLEAVVSGTVCVGGDGAVSVVGHTGIFHCSGALWSPGAV